MNNHVRVGDVADVIAGQHIESALYHDHPTGTPYLTGPADFGEIAPRITKWTNAPKVFASSSDVLVTVKGAGVGKSNLGCEAAIGRQVMALRPRPGKLLQSYLFHFIRSQEKHISRLADGATVPGIGKEDLASLSIPNCSVREQRRIAAILDKADALRRQRQRAVDLLDSLTQSIFLEMFGDPAENPNSYPMKTVGQIADRMSDGPFGSNLKSEHYVESGVRVVRLQNIGVGKFVDNDAAYVSEDHFGLLKKHECLPGDILIGTLGDPNLRACIQPDWLRVALNKADCVQLRVNPKQVLAEYATALINNPSTEKMAHSLILGQTRARISMGRLRDLAVPIPPLEAQREFAAATRGIAGIAKGMIALETSSSALFASLQSRAFAGEL